MAYQLPPGTDPNVIAALNAQHRSLVALEASKSHYDGPEFLAATGVEQVLSSFFGSAPTTMAGALDTIERGILLHDDHVGRSNAGSGLKTYAHKVVGTPIGGTASSAGAVLEQAMVDEWGPVALALATWLQVHMLSATYHSTADTFNALGTLPGSIATKAELSRILNLTRAVLQQHLAFTAGGVHGVADTANVTTAAPVDTQDDWDGMKALMTELILDLGAHGANTGGSYHAATDGRALPSAPSFPAAVSTSFARANALKAAHNTHLGSTSEHESADSTNTLSSANATTVASLVTLAAEVYTDQTAHFRLAPVSPAVR